MDSRPKHESMGSDRGLERESVSAFRLLGLRFTGPSRPRTPASDSDAFGFTRRLRSRVAALTSEHHGCGVLAILCSRLGDLACGNPHDVDRVRDDVGWALLTLRTFRHMLSDKHNTLARSFEGRCHRVPEHDKTQNVVRSGT